MAEQEHVPLPACLIRLANIDGRLDAIDSNMDAVRKAVLGNGDPQRSLIDRVARLETTLKVLACVIVVGIAAASALAAWR